MDAPCRACIAVPLAIEGHADLRAQRIGNGHISFKCTRCGSLWGRAGDACGGFVWTGLSERAARGPAMGIAVPPRSSAFHPFGEQR